MTNSNDSKSNNPQANRAAILKELESVRSLLKEDTDRLPLIEAEQNKKKQLDESVDSAREEFQIPLLDPGKSTTYELDFSKPEAEKKVFKATLMDIPVLDDITHSGSLFDDHLDEQEESPPQKKPDSAVSKAALKDHAQLIIQDLLNEIIPDIEDKLADMIPALEEKLKKRLEQAMTDYIEKTVKP